MSDPGAELPELELVTIGIISRERTEALVRLATRLSELSPAWPHELVIAVEDAESQSSKESTVAGVARWLDIPARRGFGFNRNAVLAAARGDVIVFVDSDCEPHADWLQRLLGPLANPDIDAVMGGLHVPKSTFLGDAISALGFPAGGSVGFDVMFAVDELGRTHNLSTANCAVRRRVFDELGGFDDRLVAGGEDTELAYRMTQAGKNIVYEPRAVVVHPPRTGLGECCRWFFRRGRAKHGFIKRVPAAAGHVRQRLASWGKIIWIHRWKRELPLILVLLGLTTFMQQLGFIYELVRPREDASPSTHENTTDVSS